MSDTIPMIACGDCTFVDVAEKVPDITAERGPDGRRYGTCPKCGKSELWDVEVDPAKQVNGAPPTDRVWSFRYNEYARAHRCSPERMLERDRARYPGGKMAGYMLWVGARLQAFADLNGWKRDLGPNDHVWSDEDYAAFDEWLRQWVDRATGVAMAIPSKEIVKP